MPGIVPVYTPNDKKVIELGNVERKARVAMIEAAWKYYDEGGSRKPLKVRPGQPDDNVILNLSAQVIDKAVAFCAPKPPTFVMPNGMERRPGADGRMENILSPEQVAVNAFLESNEFDYQLIDILLSGFVSGHTFLRLFPPDNTAEISTENPPRLAMLDPRFIVKFWDVSDIRRTLWYRLTWAISDDVFRRQDIVPTWMLTPGAQPDPMLGYKIMEYQGKGEDSTQYEKISEDDWPYPFAPIVEWKNKHAPREAYGESDLKGADLNDAINFIASNTGRIIKYHAHPKTVAIGVSQDQIKATSIDGLWTLPEGASVQNLEMQSDLASSLQYLNMLRTEFFTEMHSVDFSTIKDRLGTLTNFAVRVLFKDMSDTADTKRSVYGNGLAESIRRACVMMGFADAPKPKDKWADPLPENRLEVVQSLEKEKQLGAVSTQTVQEDLHRDPEVESERMAEEQNNRGDNLVNVLTALNQRSGGFQIARTAALR